ncbi:MAG: rod shape-determining protein MreD [Chloroflexota bacterium]
MGGFVALPLIILGALVQATWASRLRLLGVTPDVVLVLVIGWAVVRGLREGLLIALVGGLTMEALTGAPLGMTTAALVLATWLASVAESNVFRSAWYLPYVSIAIATPVYYGTMLLFMRLAGRPLPWMTMLGRVVVPSVTLNLLLMPAVYAACRWLHRGIGPEVVEW